MPKRKGDKEDPALLGRKKGHGKGLSNIIHVYRDERKVVTQAEIHSQPESLPKNLSQSHIPENLTQSHIPKDLSQRFKYFNLRHMNLKHQSYKYKRNNTQ